MTRQLTQLDIIEVSLVGNGADQDAHITLAKTADETPEETDMTTLEDVAKAAGDLSDEDRAKLYETLGVTATVTEPEPTPEVEVAPVVEATVTTDDETTATEVVDVTKSAEFIELQKKSDENETKIAKMVSDQEEAVAIAKAADDYGYLGDTVELGKVMYRVQKGTPSEEDLTLLAETLRAASAQIKTGDLFGTVGSSEQGSSSSDAVIKGIATEIQKSQPELTPEKAFRLALETPEGQRIYAESLLS